MSFQTGSIWAAAPSTIRGQPTHLSVDSKGERIAYASNKSIFLRSIDNPSISTQYTGHTSTTSVARFSPSGFYVASGDVSGTVRVWDCKGEGATKGEYHIISGRINDLAWDGDSQRIIAVGDGKERFGHCITADTGNSVGEISGHSSQINSVSIRQQRPLRAATVSDDTSLVFYHGAPFKFNTSSRDQHKNFIYGVAFSPDGNSLVSVGADRKICLYDGKTGASKTCVGEGEHKGSIFSVSWSSDSSKFVTASADQTVKVWDATAGQSITSWKLGEGIPSHQVGVVWPAGRTDGLIISLSLSGDLNYLDSRSPKPIRIIQGHQKNITTACLANVIEPPSISPTLWSGSYDGRICSWDLSNGTATVPQGTGHTNQISGIASPTFGSNGSTHTVGWDDTLRSVISNPKPSFLPDSVKKLPGQPLAIASLSSGHTLVATTNPCSLTRFNPSNEPTGSLELSFTPTALATYVSASATSQPDIIAIGGADAVLRIYASSVSSHDIALIHTQPPYLSPVSALCFHSSPAKTATPSSHPTTSVKLAAGHANGKILVFSIPVPTSAPPLPLQVEQLTDRWGAHTARVTSIAWNRAGTHAVSGGLDTNLFLWSLEKPGRRIKQGNAHKEGVTGVIWDDLSEDIDGGRILSVGGDAAVKTWMVKGLL